MALTALIRRPSRVAQLEQLLNRYRWTNAGLRERLDQLTTERDRLVEALADAGHPTTMTHTGTITIHGKAHP